MNDSLSLHACVSIGSSRATFELRLITHGVKLVGGRPLYVCDTASKTWSLCCMSRYRPAVMRDSEGGPPPSSSVQRSAEAAVLAAVDDLNRSGLLRSQIGDDAVAMLRRIPVHDASRLVQELQSRAHGIHKPGRWLIAACTQRVASQIGRYRSTRATRPQAPEDPSSDCQPALRADTQQPASCCSTRDCSSSRAVTSSCVNRLLWTDDAGYTWLGFTNPENGALWWWCESSGEWLYDTTLYSQPRIPEWTACVDGDPQRLWWHCTATGEWYWDIRHRPAEAVADTGSACAWRGRGRGIGLYLALDRLEGRGFARQEPVPWKGRGSGQRKQFLHKLQGGGLARTFGGAIFGVLARLLVYLPLARSLSNFESLRYAYLTPRGLFQTQCFLQFHRNHCCNQRWLPPIQEALLR